MKILISVPDLTIGSGLSRYVLSLCQILSPDNDVAVLTTHNDPDTSYERNALAKISSGIKLISLGSLNKYYRYFKTIQEIKKYDPDIIVNNYNAVIQYILPFVKKKIKAVHILHNDTDDFYRIGSINGKYVDGWIAPTQAIADHFNTFTRNQYVEKVTVIPHGVESSQFYPRHNSKLEIVYAGVLYEHKGVMVLPDIMQQLKEKLVDFHLTIIGGGILEDWLRDKFEKDLKNGLVTMTGVVEHEDVYRLMSKADIFLYPTHLDAFGLVIAEAMMNGAVPVVTLLPGITDNLITDNVDGFLLPKDDVGAFAAVISELAHNNDERNLLNRKAHEKAKSRFSMDIMKKNYMEYFQHLF